MDMPLPPLPQAIDAPGGAPSPHDAGDRGDKEYAYKEPATIRQVCVGPQTLSSWTGIFLHARRYIGPRTERWFDAQTGTFGSNSDHTRAGVQA